MTRQALTNILRNSSWSKAEAPPAGGSQVDHRGTDGMDIHRRNGRLLVTEAELRRWLSRARPGDAFHYHRGYLPLDTVLHAKRVTEHERGELALVAQCALDAARRGLAHVVQRRHGRFDYTYIVVARTPRRDGGAVS